VNPFRWLCLLHLVGNALLLGLGYYWLGVGEANTSNLVLSFAVILFFLGGAAWLHGMSLAYFRDPRPVGVHAMLLGPLRRIAPLFVLLILAVALSFSLRNWQPLGSSQSTMVASYFTMTLQTPVRPASVQQVFDATWWLIQWVLLPILILPLASGVATHGWSGFREFGIKLKSWSYWILVPSLLLCAAWVPPRLITWKPATGSFGVEMTSLMARTGLAYLLFVAACLLLAFVTSRGRPSLSQSSTVASE